MKEKLLFLGLLILSVLYWVEVVPIRVGSYEWYQYLGLGITILTVVPWLISILVDTLKKRKAKEKKAAEKAAAKAAKQAEDK
ncbi:MAG: hypothetical protein J6A55_06125 [Oscillospiraceae bacterium]|nr:hypothetical protein [Oscillospiraceae bacterium]